MGRLFISEYSHAAVDELRQPIGAPMEPSVAEQVVPIGPESVRSKPFSARTRFVMISCDVPCSIAFGVEPKASQDLKRMGAGECRPFGVGPGMCVAVIENE